MNKGKRIVVAILIILILLLLAGGAFAYVYIATDLLRTDKEMFFKSFAQITVEDGFINKGINDFNEKKKQMPFDNSGKITFGVEYPEEELENVVDKVNDLSITFSGKSDFNNEKIEQNIQVDYGNNIIFPLKYKQDGNKFGVQSDKLSKQYIAIKNENLDEFFEKLLDDEDSIFSTSEKIEGITETLSSPTEIAEKMQFTEEETKQLEEIYGKVLDANLLDENFTSVKTEQNESYILELTSEQVKNLMIKIVEATKQNTLIIDKINKIITETDPESEKIELSMIDDLIKGINEEEVSEIPNVKITLGLTNKMLNQIVVESGVGKISINKSVQDNTLNYNINYNLKEEQEESSSILQQSSELGEVNVYFNIKYTGLETLSNVESNYEIGFDINADGQVMKYDYKIINNTLFKDFITIEELDENTAVFLNSYNKEQIINFLTQVGTRLGEVNKNQMEQLGLKEYENPLLYTNPVTSLVIMYSNMASEIVNDSSSLSEYEIQQFNSKFVIYEGENVSSSNVNALIQTVSNHNLSTELENQSDTYVKVTIDGIEITGSGRANIGDTYVVEAIYNDEGRIVEMKVTTENQ